MKKPNHYTAQDIERYHNGKLSPAEMNALEKAALEDPFLADALEGYAFTNTASSDLAGLQQKLQKRIEGERRKNVFFMGPAWMKIAALFILFAGGGWLVFQTLNNKGEEIATNEQLEQQPPVTTTEKATDTMPVFTGPTMSDQTVAAEKQEVKSFPLQSTSANEQQQPANTNPVPLAPQTSKLAAKEKDADKGYNTSDIMALREGKFMDTLNRSKAIAMEQINSGSFKADSIKNFDVVLQRSEAAVDEVVIMNKKSVASDRKSRMQIMVDTLEPAEGWGYFDDYIASNIKSPDELKMKPVRGEVELTFDVNQQGEPVNITVTRSLCTACDKEAIRLLKEGPKWKNKSRKGKIKIRF